MSKKKKQRKNSKKRKLFLPIFLILLLFASLAATVYFVFLGPGTYQEHRQATSSHYPPEKPQIIYEEPAPDPGLPLILPGSVKKRLLPREKAMLALVIDDMGYKKSIGNQLLDIDMPISFAFLPFGPHTKTLVKKARQKKRDILLHMPMEAMDNKWDPGPGALYTSMTRQEIKKKLEEALQSMHPVIGANNHMGSRFTASKAAMEPYLSFLEEKNLFFLDSLTSSQSVGYSMASEMGIRTARRDIFIDNSQDKDDIKKQLASLTLIARKRGVAIGIGHPYPATLEALKEYQAKLQEGVTVVAIHRLMQ